MSAQPTNFFEQFNNVPLYDMPYDMSFDRLAEADEADIAPTVAEVAPHAGEAACRTQVAVTAEAQQPKTPRIEPWSSVVRFAEAQNYNLAEDLTEKLFIGLRPGQLNRKVDELTPVVSRLWHIPRKRTIEKYEINLDVAVQLARLVIPNAKSYKNEAKAGSRTFGHINADAWGLFANYLNTTMELPEDEQLPLRGAPKPRVQRPKSQAGSRRRQR